MEQVEEVRRVEKFGKAAGGKGRNSGRKSDRLPKGFSEMWRRWHAQDMGSEANNANYHVREDATKPSAKTATFIRISHFTNKPMTSEFK